MVTKLKAYLLLYVVFVALRKGLGSTHTILFWKAIQNHLIGIVLSCKKLASQRTKMKKSDERHLAAS